jgi:hypothetical protein
MFSFPRGKAAGGLALSTPPSSAAVKSEQSRTSNTALSLQWRVYGATFTIGLFMY